MSAPQFKDELVIAVPATINTYTDIFPRQPIPASQAQNNVGDTSLLGTTVALKAGFPAGVTIEMWLLSPVAGLDPLNIANYTFGQLLLTAAGSVTVPLASYPGFLFRAKSGGTAGNATLWFSAD